MHFLHMAVPYNSDEGFLHLVGPHVERALGEGRHVLAITAPARLDLLDRRVERRVAARWYEHPPRTLAATHEYADGRRTLIVGEPPWQSEAWIRFESVLNAALRGQACTALCLYSAPPEHMWLTHPAQLAPNGVRPSERYVEPHDLILDSDRAPLADPVGEVRAAAFTAPELARLRQLVADYARSAGMERNLISSLVLSVSEVAANSVEHGAGHGTLKVWTNGREVVCEIIDPGGSLTDPLPGYMPPEPESQRGYGLWISRQLCDLVETRTDAGVLRVRLHQRLR
ncbi:anti-sigma factor RsbA family regulatory protein [Nonomuraea soli]|uniref:Anti-sigma regulatory factor (Ser/Thr protein kinase) n=1 Tax=Nonomuraea soli TaxID=1032476 RepID=A0A7W0CMV6_9ACTN|nr:anti-sigma factor RsbA family regulatory protein [Nonomuraea soli]MBA2893969.1 anti-sigma regulatory factor (Ser/Thr protein kinase) [Nonomuraea soli]